MYNCVTVSTRIKTLAKSKKIPLKAMLSELGLGVNLISQVANGQNITSANLTSIADYLDCSVDYLLGRTDNPSSTVNSIEGNVTGSAVVQGSHNGNVTVTNGASALTEEETELLRLFQSLDVKRRVKLLNFGFSLEGEASAG